jgi:6-phosphogluconolactonase
MDSALPDRLTMHDCASPTQLAERVAAAVRDALSGALRERGSASLVVPGGSTPRGYFPLLAQSDLPWERVHITLSDERCVPSGHADSNEALARALLLQDRAAQARFVPLYREADADAAAGAAERLRALARPFDLVLLGLGADSHIASLFPGAAGLEAALDPNGQADCCAVVPPPGTRPALPRVSLTLSALLDSRRVLIAAQGIDKRAAFERAALGRWPMPSPLHALATHARQPVEFLWCAA